MLLSMKVSWHLIFTVEQKSSAIRRRNMAIKMWRRRGTVNGARETLPDNYYYCGIFCTCVAKSMVSTAGGLDGAETHSTTAIVVSRSPRSTLVVILRSNLFIIRTMCIYIFLENVNNNIKSKNWRWCFMFQNFGA